MFTVALLHPRAFSPLILTEPWFCFSGYNDTQWYMCTSLGSGALSYFNKANKPTILPEVEQVPSLPERGEETGGLSRTA